MSPRTRTVDRFEFDPADLTRLLEVAAWLSAHRDGWLNLLPGVEAHAEVPDTPGPFAIFGSAVPPVSMCTWMPPGRGRHAAEEVTVGIMHARGTRVVPELAQAGLGVPPAWRVVGDHPRRGLVLRVPTSARDAQVLAWALAAGSHLCQVPVTGTWQAEVFHPLGWPPSAEE